MLVLWIILYGVFLEVFLIGVLIIGEFGLGKSELVLELISCGYWLVVDDVIEFILIVFDVIDGICFELLQDLLEVCGLGVFNVCEMFGYMVVKVLKYLCLVIYLKLLCDGEDIDVLICFIGDIGYCEIFEVQVLMIIILVVLGCNFGVLVEVVVCNYVFKSKGFDLVQIFID